MVALICSGGSRQAWPFSHWWLYHSGNPEPMTSAHLHQVRFVGADGKERRLWPRELFTLDDDSSSQDMGHNILDRSVDEKNPDRERYRAALVRRLAGLVGEVGRIEIWRVEWAVRHHDSPPLHFAQASSERLVLALRGSASP